MIFLLLLRWVVARVIYKLGGRPASAHLFWTLAQAVAGGYRAFRSEVPYKIQGSIMPANQILTLSYIAFIWMVILHTFEEISCGIMELQLGHIKMMRNRYLLAASAISTVNLVTLALIVLENPVGYYLGLFTSAVIGVFQAIVHGIGYWRNHKSTRGMGAGFYSSIPLAIIGLMVFVQIMRILVP